MNRGLNRPFIVMAESEGMVGREEVVVKCRAGYGDSPEAMLREVFALMMARRLREQGVGLLTPEPVWVNLPTGLDYAAADHPEHAGLIRQSPGWNLGTVHLGSSWKPWLDTARPKSIPLSAIETAYSFDAMVENSDRGRDNPNLLWRDSELAVLDFDKAFAYSRTHSGEARPWRETLQMMNLERHCLYSFLSRPADRQPLGRGLWDAFEEWWLDAPTAGMLTEIGSKFADPDLDLPLLESYLRKLSIALEDFFPYLTDVTCL